MSALLLQGRLLRERRRFAEARAAIRQHLANSPDDFGGHLELAITSLMEGKDHRAALDEIHRAIGLDPENAHAYCVKSAILNALDRNEEAVAAADEARRIDPENPMAWHLRGAALLDLRRLSEAEEAARKSLALDPGDASASNLLSTVLRLQQRFDEAEIEIGKHLARDPESAWTFATAGWTALNQGNRRQAEDMFREALRLDPEMEQARIGLREAYKARSWFYRLFLRWVFFMQRHSERNRWLIVIGLYLAYRFGRELLAKVHPMAATALVVIYLLFVFGSSLVSGLGHFLLLKDRTARLSLNRAEKLDGLTVGILFLGGMVLLAAGMTVLPAGIAFVGGTMIGAAIPGGMVFCNGSRYGRLLFAALALVVLACGITVSTGAFAEEAPLLISVGALVAVASTWLGNIRSLTRARPE